MPRYALLIEYDGGPFCGWQRQADLPTVQGAVEAAFKPIEPGDVTIQGAGRTDTGVHALGQVAHVDLGRDWAPHKLCSALNFHLKPAPVAILDAAPVPDDFNARFDALARAYLFRLQSRRAPLAVDQGRVWRVAHGLNAEAMRAAALHLVGQHDFTTFRASQCQANSPVKTIDSISVEEMPVPGGMEYRFHFAARSFLHNQVRSIVGTLERVGAGAWQPDDVLRALNARDRAACGQVSPPDGLYLRQVTYPNHLFED